MIIPPPLEMWNTFCFRKSGTQLSPPFRPPWNLELDFSCKKSGSAACRDPPLPLIWTSSRYNWFFFMWKASLIKGKKKSYYFYYFGLIEYCYNFWGHSSNHHTIWPTNQPTNKSDLKNLTRALKINNNKKIFPECLDANLNGSE